MKSYNQKQLLYIILVTWGYNEFLYFCVHLKHCCRCMLDLDVKALFINHKLDFDKRKHFTVIIMRGRVLEQDLARSASPDEQHTPHTSELC